MKKTCAVSSNIKITQYKFMKMAECLTLQDFPTICRICLKNTELKPFSEEKYLSDIFMSITNIKIAPHDNLPRNVCRNCLNKIEDISIFINVSKLNNTEFLQKLAREEEDLCLQENEIIIIDNGTSIKIEENEIDLQTEVSESNQTYESTQLRQLRRRKYSSMFRYVCRLCVARKNLKVFSKHRQLVNVFRSITNIAVSPEDRLPQNICCECIQKIQNAAYLIELSKSNDRKLQHILSDQAKKDQCLDESKEMTRIGIHSEIKIEDDIIMQVESDSRGNRRKSIKNNIEKDVESHSTQDQLVSVNQNSTDVSKGSNDEDQLSICIESRDISVTKPKITSHLKKGRSSRHLKSEFRIKKTSISNEDFASLSKEKPMESHSNKKQKAQFLKPLKIILAREKWISDMASLLTDKRLCSQDQNEIQNISDIANDQETSGSFKCKICLKKFSNNYQLTVHKRIHKDKEQKGELVEQNCFECNNCQKKFTKKKYLIVHMIVHSGKRPFQCTICSQTFTQKGSLSKHHDAVHLQKRDCQCPICHNYYPTNYRLKVHMQTHTEEKMFKCSSCPKSFIMESYLKRHIKVHSQRDHFECQICSKIFGGQINLRKHIKTHTSRELIFKCAVCLKGFSQKGDLTKHVKIHSAHRPYKCSICSMDFTIERYLKKHMVCHQKRELSYHCTLCPQRFHHPSNLGQHLKIHQGEKRIKCNFCNKRFYHKSMMLIHQRVHTGEKPYPCTLCPKRFSHSASLSLHMRWHSGEKPFKCEECGQCFRKQSYVKIHMRTHTGERPYQCELCDKSFRHDNVLRLHMIIHSGIKPFQCSVCSKRFSSLTDMKVHMRIHTGEKPYKCSICPSRFAHSASLKAHLRRHNGEKPYTCSACSKSFVRRTDIQSHIERKHRKVEEGHCEICSKSFSNIGNLRRHNAKVHKRNNR